MSAPSVQHSQVKVSISTKKNVPVTAALFQHAVASDNIFIPAEDISIPTPAMLIRVFQDIPAEKSPIPTLAAKGEHIPALEDVPAPVQKTKIKKNRNSRLLHY